MIDVSGRWTSAPIETTFRPRSRASSSSGSYEIAMSTRPAASSFSGSEGSAGVTGTTSRPTARKSPWAIAA